MGLSDFRQRKSSYNEELEFLNQLEQSRRSFHYREVFDPPDPVFTQYVYDQAPTIPQASLYKAKLYSDRNALIDALPKKLSIVEIGVALGDFSEELIRRTNPKYFGAIDTFEGAVETFGSDRSDLGTIFQNTSHLNFYRDRMKRLLRERPVVELEIIKGISWEKIGDVKTQIDLFYLDAGHSFEEVLKDVRACLPKVSKRGFLLFNDYCWGNLFGGYLYGVIPVVNALCCTGKWKVHSFAFEKGMFCDICLQRR